MGAKPGVISRTTNHDRADYPGYRLPEGTPMTRELNVHGLPSVVTPQELSQGIVVVIDVLRASTTIVHALEAGADTVVPCLEIDEARRVAAQLPASEVVLGGERGGLLIDGFDLGNSPSEYTAQAVEGRTVVFTTTNGTRAMMHCRQAQRVLIGAFVNARAVVEELVNAERVHLLCAGTEGDYSRDDVLLAGLLVERLTRRGGMNYQLNVQALTARENWTSSFALPHALGAEPLKPERLAAELSRSPAGRRLTAIDREDDILVASQLDRFDCVPELDPKAFRIRRCR
jgi:2-phosphosulfolactate phosphatase